MRGAGERTGRDAATAKEEEEENSEDGMMQKEVGCGLYCFCRNHKLIFIIFSILCVVNSGFNFSNVMVLLIDNFFYSFYILSSYV